MVRHYNPGEKLIETLVICAIVQSFEEYLGDSWVSKPLRASIGQPPGDKDFGVFRNPVR